MPGIQATERTSPAKPMRRGEPEKYEFEYIRHGTQTLLAGFDVVHGKIVAASVGATRTEEDFLQYIRQVIAADPAAGWIFVVDQLNIHMSESLVRLVASECGLDLDLGIKGKSGILQRKQTRKEFLSAPEHRIRFVYTPKHTSWLNQIEIWFSVLVRRVIRRGNFTSQQDLRQKILAFVDYFNQVLAGPYKWTFTGRPRNL